MLSFDKLLIMTDEQKNEYLKQESDKIISAAAPKRQLGLRHLQSKCDSIRRTSFSAEDSAGKITALMMQSLDKLNKEMERL